MNTAEVLAALPTNAGVNVWPFAWIGCGRLARHCNETRDQGGASFEMKS